MKSKAIAVTARLSFLSTEEGGRSEPINSHYSYRPNHNLLDETNIKMYMGEIAIPDGTTVRPGDTIETTIRFIVSPEYVSEFIVGRKWRIQEGRKLVALGEMLAVEPDQKS